MSLFQCPKCGCRENTATGYFWEAEQSGEDPLCSACHTGKWHGKFERVFLPKGEFVTNRVGNIEHISGDQDIYKYQIHPPCTVTDQTFDPTAR